MRSFWVVAWFPVLACSSREVESRSGSLPIDSPPASVAGPLNRPANEHIPAEWTVFEDTSRTGEVTTASLQLPAAKAIEGLLEEEAPRLILRCVDGKVEASIDTEASDSVEPHTVPIQLDSAPACE